MFGLAKIKLGAAFQKKFDPVCPGIPNQTNPGDTQALSSRNTIIRSGAKRNGSPTKILRTQRRLSREMLQKASKAWPRGLRLMLQFTYTHYNLYMHRVSSSKNRSTSSSLPPHVLSFALFCSAGYRLWINGLFAWHKNHPEMSLRILQMATRWFGSKEVKLANVAITLCRAMGDRGVRDLSLPLANGLLAVLHADMLTPSACLCALDLLKHCQPIYNHLDVEVVFELFESSESWKDWKVRAQAMGVVDAMLETIMMDDEAYARATHKITSMLRADKKDNMKEAATNKQELIGLLKGSKVRK